MKKQVSVILLSLFCVAGMTITLASCSPKSGPKQSGGKKMMAAKASASESDLYKMDIKPLPPQECGRCHNSQFTWLKEKGGKHQMECTVCHEKYHSYNPRKNNWNEIMPKCQECHDLPHGDDFKDCMNCHQQPHAPKVIQFAKLDREVKQGNKTVVVCAVCHKKEGEEFAKYPSLHNTELNCQGCHADVHGTIPSCLDCHDPHIEGQVFNDCLQCHSPHSASHIRYNETVPNRFCSACHEEPYESLQNNITKHSALQCATCHESHGEIPDCRDCHGEPHGEGLHKRFTSCLECHINPHNLPVNHNK